MSGRFGVDSRIADMMQQHEEQPVASEPVIEPSNDTQSDSAQSTTEQPEQQSSETTQQPADTPQTAQAEPEPVQASETTELAEHVSAEAHADYEKAKQELAIAFIKFRESVHKLIHRH